MDIPVIKCGILNKISDTNKFEDMEYTDIDANDIIIKDYKRIDPNKKNKTGDRVKPTFIHEKCIRCRKCIDICPASALSMVDKKIVLNEDKCVMCYCCHEVCPAEAIEIRN
jgi:ferredoxin